MRINTTSLRLHFALLVGGLLISFLNFVNGLTLKKGGVRLIPIH